MASAVTSLSRRGLLGWAGVLTLAPLAGTAWGQPTVYGSQLMSREELGAYRERLRSARNAEERNRIRAEHHKQMQERARERGVRLPDMPPSAGQGGGMGPGGGIGPGMGSGAGRGGGMGGGMGH